MTSFKPILVLLLLAFIQFCFAADLDEQICECDNDPCCNYQLVDIKTQNVLQTGTVADDVVTESYGNFSAVVATKTWEKNTINLFSPLPLSCTSSKAFIFESDGAAEPIAEVSLIQVNPNTCQANFTKLISDSDLRKDLDLVLGFADISSPLGAPVTAAFLEDVVPYTNPSHRWIVTEFAQNDDEVDVSLNIQVNPDSGHNSACLEASNQANMYFQFTPALDAPGTEVECKLAIDDVTVNAGDNTVRMDLAFLQSVYTRCYRQTPEQIGADIRYTYEVVPVIDGCTYYEDYPSHIFTITLDNEINVNATANANSMILDYIPTSLTIVPCTPELDDVDPLVPLAKLDFTLEAVTGYGTEATSVVLNNKFIGDIQLDEIGATNYESIAGRNTKATFNLRTSECLFVDTIHSATPISTANLLSCSIDYLPAMTVVATATYQDGFTETNNLQGDERDIVFESSSIGDCAGISIADNDVAQQYGARLVVEDLNGRSDDLNLNNPIVARVELTNLDLAEETGVSVVLNELIVTLDDEYRRTYSQSDKDAQMLLEFTPYYQDGHFCRKYTSVGDICSRFYEQTSVEAEYADKNWNAYLQTLYDVGTSGFFKTDGSGRKYEGCQDLSQSSQDSFVFTPSDWVFGSFPRTSGVMFFQATAYLRSCTSTGRRLLREVQLTGHREMQGSEVAIVFNNVTIVNSNVIIQPEVPSLPNTALNAQQEAIFIAVLVLVSVGLGAMCCVMFCGVGFFGRIWSKAQSKIEDAI